MNLLWCVTGAGHLLLESFALMQCTCSEHEVTVAFSGAGSEVARLYGLQKMLVLEFKEVISEPEQGYSSPLVGRLAKHEYDLVIVAPCTANTVAKIVRGIADSLITNLVAQAVKSSVPVYIVPTDYAKIQETTMPMSLDQETCRTCEVCPPLEQCPQDAIYRDDRVRINGLRCTACKTCIELCTYAAISFGGKVRVHIRDLDIENTRRLEKLEGIMVFRSPDAITV
jgi:dihydromethanopterin reductase (acceptor)